VAVPLHWYRSIVINLKIIIRAVESANQLGGQFTKGLGKIHLKEAEYHLFDGDIVEPMIVVWLRGISKKQV
jgi:hypothetical protein